MSRIRDDDPRVVARIGRGRGHGRYRPSAWHERDNFPTVERAREYAELRARMYPQTPYRVVKLHDRYAVQYVPAWKLEGETA